MHFWNPPHLVRWNLTKRYLLDLEQRGVGVVPTVLLDEPASIHLPSLLAARGWSQAVVKPVVGASGHGATLVTRDRAHAVTAAIDEGRIRRPVIVQPFVEDIRTSGEWSMVFIDGALTHSVLKRPAQDDFRVQSSFGGTSRLASPPQAVAEAGLRSLGALPAAPLYARVDGIETGAGFLIMELEVHEPSLYFGAAPEAARVFAEAILRRI